jgi:glycosyltransferase involved in cell wall biosynthesis
MNVHIISQGIYPCVSSGMEIYNYYFARELSREGLDVTIHTQCESLKVNEKCKKVLLLNQNVINIPYLSIWFSILINLTKCRKTIDIIYVPYTSNSSLVYPILLFKTIFNIPYIVVIHGGGLKPWKDPIIQKKFFTEAGKIVAVSTPIKEEYEKRTGKEIKVIPPLVPFNKSPLPKEKLRNKYGFKINDIIIVFVGSIKEIKGCDTLLNAFCRLGKEYVVNNSIHLVYVGDGDLRKTLEARVKEQNFSDNIIFLGILPHEQIPEILKIADIYIIPSLYEGTSISLLEAMFNGLPIIGSDTRGINNIIFPGRNGVLFETRNPIDLSKKLKNMLENIEYYNKLGEQAAVDYNYQWHPKKANNEHIEIIREIVGV